MTGNPCLEAALAYAANAQRSLFVFPAKPGEKKSRVSKRFKADGQNWGMTNNATTIKSYWDKWPDSNVCLVTGEINGFFVLETDTAEGHIDGVDGGANLQELIAANGGLWPPTLTAQSPTGSIHYYFTWPAGDYIIRNSASKIAKGVDIRGDGGMVLAPPSIRSPKDDRRYRWISDAGQGMVNAPDWLLKLIMEKIEPREMNEPQTELPKLAAALDIIPNPADFVWEVEERKTGKITQRAGWDGWNDIAMAIFRSCGGSDEGFVLFDKWCAKNPEKYDQRYTKYTWYRRYRTSPPKTLGAGTLFMLADNESPGWRAVYDEENRDDKYPMLVATTETRKTGDVPPDDPPTKKELADGKEAKAVKAAAQKETANVATEKVVASPPTAVVPDSDTNDTDDDNDDDDDQTEELAITETASRVEVKYVDKDLDLVVDAMQKALMQTGSPIYVHAGRLVTPYTTPMPSAVIKNAARKARLFVLEIHSLSYLINKKVKCTKYDKKQKKWLNVYPPTKAVNTLLGLPPGHWQFQRIKGVVSTPTMRPDGTLLIDEGYDDMTGLLLVEPPAMPPIPAMPTKDEGRLALNLLKELLQEVLFIEDEGVSLAVALSVLLTPIVRGAFNMAPLHVVRAPAAGSGKSYMFDIASEIATGGPLNILSAADGNAEELRKRIDTAMLEGQPIISIDNFSGDLKSSSLAQYVERQLVNIRVLGESKSVEVDTSGTTFGVNGNNLVITGADLPRRTIQAMIDTKMEKPEFREYKIDPVQMIRADRSKYIAACLTVCLAYRAAGQPGKMVINSFAGWSDTVRSALMWLGEADPVKSQERVREDDTELSALGDFLTQTALEMGVDRLYFMHEIVKASRTSTVGAGHEEVDYDSPEFHQAVFRIGSRNGKAADPLLASRWARTMVKRIENGLFLDMEQRKGGTAKWVIRRTPFNKTEYPGQRNLEHEHDGKIKVLRPKPTMGNNEQS